MTYCVVKRTARFWMNKGSCGKDSGMTVRRNDATAYCCARWRKRIDGRNEPALWVREGNAGYVLEEQGCAVANSLRLAITKGAGKTAVCREVTKCLSGGKAGKGKAMAEAFFSPTGILLCAVPKRIACHWTYRWKRQDMDCRHMGILGRNFSTSALDWWLNLLNDNCTGGWVAVACAGFAQTKGKHLT